MQIFELHFNPKLKENQVFDTFIFEPENAEERRLGSLYMAGEIKNALPKQSNALLEGIAKTIKKNYYSISASSAEKALSKSLKKANEFLDHEIKKDNVNWLGNLNFAAFSLKNSELTFTKAGDIKILLIRGGKITDIGKNLNLEGIDPYPVKVFFNIAEGKLAEGDVLLLLTSDIFNFFKEKGVLAKIAGNPSIDSKKIKQAIPHSLFSKGEGQKIAGLSLIALIKKEETKNPLSILFEKTPQKSKKLFVPISVIARKLKFKIPKIKTKPRKVSLPKIKDSFVSLEKFKKQSGLKKKLIPIALFVFLLLIGFLIFKQSEDKKEKDIVAAFNQVEKKLKQAESLLLIQNQDEADKILKQAYKELIPLTEKDTSLMPSILSLKETIRRNLERLNKMEDIENPEIAFDVSEFTPEKILMSAGNLYLYKSSGTIQKIYIKTDEREIVELSDNTKKLDSNSGAVLAYVEENKIYYSRKGIWESKTLNAPESYNLNFDLFSSYLFNLYFVDKETCDIIKYPYLTNFEWGLPTLWHKDLGKTCLSPESIAIDGSIWILNEDNSITRYYTGEFQETIKLDIFPFPKKFTGLNIRNNLYILEPENNRLIIAEKNGKIIKQFHSEQFDNLKSFAVSENGKTIYLLNGSKIYKLEI